MKQISSKQLFVVFYILIVGTVLGGCATIYTAPGFDSIKFQHKMIAIMPFDVTINPANKSANVTPEELAELAIKQRETFQRALYTQFLQKHQKGQYSVHFQDFDKTNTLLKRELEGHATRKELSEWTKSEICEILKVDAIISGSMTLSKPMGAGAAIASRLLLGFGGPTNRANSTISIHESVEGKLVWSYDHTARGGLLSTSEGVAKSLMKGIALSFPYEQ